ncbi:MAG: Calx-beta domain-containing protein, partial [Anaerolineae bacterium]
TYDTWHGHLFLSDGNSEEVYDISPGLNGVFDGVPANSPPGDDTVTHFDTDRMNVHNPEGVEFDPHTGHLYILGGAFDPIAETTLDGKLIRYIDILSLHAMNPGSLAYAPSSADPSEWHLYILERGVDNNQDPNENDGKAYEISFPPGETTKTFTVPITDDTIAEGAETVNLTLSSPVSATLGQSSATLTIVDEFSGVQFSAATYDVNEGAGSATITATLDMASAVVVTVDYTASGGTATAGSDYVVASGTLTFPVGVTTQTFSVTVVDDDVDEVAQETVNLALSNPGNAELGTPTSAVLRIQDNDPPPTVQFSPPVFAQNEHGANAVIGVELSAPSAFLITVDYATSNGTATAGSDYLATSGTLTFTPGTTTQSFSVSILDDALDEPNETVNLSLSNPVSAVVGTPASTLTIVDDDGASTVQFSSSSYSVSEGGGTATITVTLSAPSAQSITVQYATSNGTATAGSDYTGTSGTLTFAPGQTVRTFSVAATEDSIDEANETVNLTLSNVTNATLGTPSTATLTIVDNDDLPEVQFDASSYSVDETAGSATITVTLSAVSGKTITVDYETSDGTAVAGSDYLAMTGTLTFDPGVTVRTFTVTILNDTLNEDDETVGLTLSNPSNVSLDSPSSATLTIVQDVLRVYLPLVFRNH